MVLRALGVPAAACSLPQLRAVMPASSTTSIWTVDLAYVLDAFGTRFRYMTATIGVDQSYQSEPFYQPTLDADAARVNELFAKAAAHSIHIERRSVDDDELAALLPRASGGGGPSGLGSKVGGGAVGGGAVGGAGAGAGRGGLGAVAPGEHLVVVLCDRRHLYRPSLANGVVSGVVDTCLAYCFGAYVGHYIVLVGYDAATDAFHVLDPARPADEPLVVSAADLHTARRSHGTDEDLLLVPISQPAAFPRTPPVHACERGGAHTSARGRGAAPRRPLSPASPASPAA